LASNLDGLRAARKRGHCANDGLGVELRLGLVLFEPAGDVEHFGDVVAGAAADAVRLLGHADENSIVSHDLSGLASGEASLSSSTSSRKPESLLDPPQ